MKVADLVPSANEKADSLCCGGSLGLLNSSPELRDEITKNALGSLLQPDPDILVTACPLCKKTFAKHSRKPVRDIAEIIYEAIPGLPGRTNTGDAADQWPRSRAAGITGIIPFRCKCRGLYPERLTKATSSAI